MNIAPKEIHLWFARDNQIHSPSLISAYHTLLNEKEQEQQRRFYFEKHRHQYLITRALIRSVLSLYEEEVQPADWRFDKNEYGKPFIANPGIDSLRFNVSHTDNMIVLAITREREVGVDVEWIERSSDVVGIPEHYFSPIEVDQLKGLDEAARRSRFFDFWTLKEAYIKACGKGLSIPLDCFSYIFSPDGGLSIAFADDYDDTPEGWRFWKIDPVKTHKVALAIKDTRKDTRCRDDYSLTMCDIVPLEGFEIVDYPMSAHP